VTVSGTDSDGVRLEAVTQVAVNALQAGGTASPTSVALGTSVSFAVTVAPAAASIDRYEWDFGEGGGVVATSSASMNYIFATKGTKTVTIRVVPTKGAAMTVVIQCQVT
jgi:PKD repeat protein